MYNMPRKVVVIQGMQFARLEFFMRGRTRPVILNWNFKVRGAVNKVWLWAKLLKGCNKRKRRRAIMKRKKCNHKHLMRSVTHDT